jgi:hypothetical protein
LGLAALTFVLPDISSFELRLRRGCIPKTAAQIAMEKIPEAHAASSATYL